MVALGETPNYEQPKVEKIENANPNGENIAEFNNNPKLAQEEADRIVEGLPDTVDQLSPEQQKQFINLVEQDISGNNINFAPKDVENVPDIIPPYRQQQINNYKTIRESISTLPIDQQEALKRAEKEAISKMTEETKDVIDGDK